MPDVDPVRVLSLCVALMFIPLALWWLRTSTR